MKRFIIVGALSFVVLLLATLSVHAQTATPTAAPTTTATTPTPTTTVPGGAPNTGF